MDADTLRLVREALTDRNILRVAEKTGIAPNTLYRIRSGRSEPHRATLLVLAHYLGIGTDAS